MNQKIENNDEMREALFNEEVPEEELHSKLGVDDHIYVTNKQGIFGGPILTFFAIFLVCSALFALFYGLVSLNSNFDERKIGVYTDEYHLKVIHSNDLYGGSISSFSKYNSSNDYYSYKFSVANNNSVDLDYAIALEVSDKSDSLNVNLISYSLLRNGISIQSDTLNNMNNELYKATAVSNSFDEYELRLWSDSLNKDLNFKFKVNVNV